MLLDDEIGKEARELVERPIIERVRIEKRSIMKVSIVLLFYFLVIVLF